MSRWKMPPEWAPQEAVWLSWPVDDPRHWGGAKREQIWRKFAEIAAVITRFETVRINAVPGLDAWLPARVQEFDGDPERVELYDHAHDDVWCRDHGPLFVRELDSGELAATDWGFNGWGERFEPWALDNTVPRQICQALDLRRLEPGMILEGGAIELNGRGQVLTTEAVLSNPNRNPGMSPAAIEAKLREYLGATELLWLGRGIEGDDTGGHIDDLARFVNDDTILACTEADSSSPNFGVLGENLERLEGFAALNVPAFTVVCLPMPQACEIPGWRLPVLPASYANFLLINGAVLVPTFRQTKGDARAMGMFRDLFPEREVIGIDCLELVEEGGALHCISQQQPALEAP